MKTEESRSKVSVPSGFGIVDRAAVARALQRQVIGMVAQRPRRLAAEEISVERGVHEPAPEAGAETGPDVAHLVELGPDPGGFERGAIIGRFVAGEAPGERLGRDHARLHRRVAALDLGDVQEARGAADQQAAGEIQARDRLEAAFVQGARAIGDAPPAGERLADRGMGLEALKLLERVEIRVLVVEPDDEADRDLAVLEVIEERAAIGRAVERPADRVHDEPGLMARGIDLPQLLEAETIGLRPAVAAQVEARDEKLGERAAAALGEQRLLGAQLDAGLEIGGRVAVLADAVRAGRDAGDALALVENFGAGETGIDLDAQRLGFLRPASGTDCRG